ncbi:hypothetical protein EW146_g10193 [Bondarzewia mesenterica]|uniref:Uncharacterized protein n=1 Tax=Bondarzewia mesenterica TaxID=1095465 RepID=A0A4S4KZJ1_9AGAM|nr:hypothetical protein EW146_g10193 [Bondarzewia mesenterica]
MDGDVYCVVLNDWASTSRLITDPFNAFSTPALSCLVNTSSPLLLFFVNKAGVLSNPAYLSTSASNLSSGSRDLQTQLNEVRSQVESTLRSFSRVLVDQCQLIDTVHQQFKQTCSAMAALSNAIIPSTQLNLHNRTLDRLLAERDSLDMFLFMVNTDAHRDFLAARREELKQRISLQQAQVEAAQASVNALGHALLPIPSPLPAPSPNASQLANVSISSYAGPSSAIATASSAHPPSTILSSPNAPAASAHTMRRSHTPSNADVDRCVPRRRLNPDVDGHGSEDMDVKSQVKATGEGAMA